MKIDGLESVAEEEQHIQIHQGIPQIPFDLFLKKTRNRICFKDRFGNLIYNGDTRVLFDSSGHPVVSIIRSNAGSWKAFKGDGYSEELLFRVEQTLNTCSKIEFNVFLVREDGEDLSLTMRGCLYWRSCTIYQDKSIVAQTSLMYTLGFKKIFMRRSKFRVTFFPGFSDYNLIAALILIFLDGR